MSTPPDDATPRQGGVSANESTAPNHRLEHEIERFLRLLYRPGEVLEVRVLGYTKAGGTYTCQLSGYYQQGQIAKAAEDLLDLERRGRAAGMYATLNPVAPDLLGRAINRLVQSPRATTTDAQIVRRAHLLIDCDPVRQTGLSSTERELALAKDRARRLRDFLRERGWPDPIAVMSGNGVHLIYRIDLPADDGGLVERVLAALADRFDDAAVKIDRAVANPSRITKIAGTMVRKGDHLVGVPGVEDRPHRRARLLRVPERIEVVARELLESIAADEAPAAPPPPPRSAAAGDGPFDRFDHTPSGVRQYLERHGVRVVKERRSGSATYLCLDRCPVLPECVAVNGTDIAVAVADSGLIAYKNLHNRGTGLVWHDVREALEPGYKAHAAASRGAPAGASGGSVGSRGGAGSADWPAPRSLPANLPPVLPFEAGLLPTSLRPWVADVAARVQCPIDFVAVAAMVALAALVGRQLAIRPKRHDDWTVVPNLWGGVVGRPGVMKTPAIQDALKPIIAMEVQAKEEFDASVAEREAAELVSRVKKKDSQREIKKAIKNPGEALRLALESILDEPPRPVRKRYVVNDSSVEKLGEILNENPRGVLVFRDELIGLLKGLEKEGQEGARAFYLEAWSGLGRFTYDRIGRGTIDIEAAILSILGGIQPGPLRQYLRAAAREHVGDDGLLQRFQLLVWPDVSKEWVNVDRPPDADARRAAHELFEGLDHLDPDLKAADPDPSERCGVPFLRFSDEAQAVFDGWRVDLERLVRSGDLYPALESHMAKFRSLIPSLALLIHLAEGGVGPVGREALDRAIGWGRYLESHARRVYSHVLQPDMAAARALAKRIVAGDLEDGFALRDVYRKGWSGLSSPEDAKGAVDVLIDLDWLAEERQPTPGRTRTTHRINPSVARAGPALIAVIPDEGTDGTDGRGAGGASGGSVGVGSGAPAENPDADGGGGGGEGER